MNEIIDVEFKEVVDLEAKSVEELKTEANNLWHQMEAVANVGIMLAAEAGARLNAIKDKLPHGEWRDWCESNLDFSYRKANNMQKLADEISKNDSIFTKTQTFANIGISKVYELLGQPEEVLTEVAEKIDVEDVSVRELKEEIKKIKAENEAMEESKEQIIENHTNTEISLRKYISELQGDLENLKNSPSSEESEIKLSDAESKIAELEEKMRNLKEEKVEFEKEKEEELSDKLNRAKAEILAEQDKEKLELEAKIKDLEEQLEEPGEDTSDLQKELDETIAERDKLQHAIKNSVNVAAFKTNLDIANEAIFKCEKIIIGLGSDQQEKCRKALASILERN